MRLQLPQLPPPPPNNKFDGDLVFKLKQILGLLINQVNNLTEGRISAVQSAMTAPPTTGEYKQGDYIRNSKPAEQGAAGSRYVVLGWTCVQDGAPGVWVQNRSLTGN
ncbi:hypothetical protein K7G19_19865 [Cupriavidus sp. DB3]|uniref:hypothetical protein n=1 Tax=Cupriavidus sp. DB3 TaxID=2873259 RepID=UPI001CF1D4D7|nr:hypothetical protein [Cupriavidus sp. DB3]MCA7085850.1 hypothetical protein [Cupriavidus sp. DB3]